MNVRTSLVLSFLLLCGCGDFSVQVVGANSELTYEALFLDDAECPNAETLDSTQVTRRVALTGVAFDVGSLSRDGTTVAVVGRDADCAVRSYGCALLEARPGQSATIRVSDNGPLGGCAAGESCVAQRCVGGDGGVEDAGPPPPTCFVQSADRACTGPESCAAPFARCEGDICETEVGCTERDVAMPAGVRVLDVGIADQMEQLDLNYIVDRDTNLYGALVDPVSRDAIVPLDLGREDIFPGESPARILMHADYRLAVFSLGMHLMRPANYGGQSIASLGGRPVMDGVGYSDLGAVSLTNQPGLGTLVFAASNYNDGDRMGDPLMISESGEDGTNGAHFAATGPVAASVGSTGPLVALRLSNGEVHIWNSTPGFPPAERPSEQITQSDIAPGWSESGVNQGRLVTTEGSMTTISQVSCAPACTISSRSMIVAESFDQVQLHEARTGRFLVARDGPQLEVLFLAETGPPLIARVPISDEEDTITDFDAHVLDGSLYVTAVDDVGEAHFYSITAP